MKGTKTELIVLVDEQDHFIGEMEKIEAHTKGVLHRAISVFVFNDEGELLLQRRALSKYHSGGLWTNTCCTHPRLNEPVLDAAARRLNEEMGIVVSLEKAFEFIYRARVNETMIENEFDHVLIGYSNLIPKPDSKEVSEWKYESIKIIEQNLKSNKDEFTVWFQISFEKVMEYLSKNH
jgi:isopentenyl-diphosphate Delta-isomerase